MERANKGSSVGKHVSDYCVLDLETTSKYLLSAKIIEIGIIRVRDNQIVDKYNVLVNPNCHIPYGATAVNHITDDMVSEAPCIQDVIDEAIDFIGEDVIVGYNNAGFDMNLVYDTYLALRNQPFTNDYIDVLHASRRSLLDVENYKLETISKYYGLNIEGEHRSLKDCYLTKECYDRLYDEFGDKIFMNVEKRSRGGNAYRAQYSPETVALQELHNLVQMIIEDKKVSLSELDSLSVWMEDHVDLQGNYPFDRIFNALDKVFADGKVTDEELEELKTLFIDFVDPVKSRSCHDHICSITGKHIVVTGDFDFGSRDSVYELISEAGGINDKGVKKATDYVVVGAKGSDAWKTGNYGGKIQKAMQLNEKGADIKIVEEADFIPAVQRIVENGMDMVKAPEGSDWRDNVRAMLKLLIVEYELPEGSLYMYDNYGQTGENKDKVISHTVYIWEPDFPPQLDMKPGQNKNVLTIKQKDHVLELVLRDTQEAELHQYLPQDAELQQQTKTDLNTKTVRVIIPDTSMNLTDYIKRHTEYCIDNYVSKVARFACCSLYNECSDAKKCIHINKLFSKACTYRNNLERGQIFYGKNRNID